MMWAKLRDLAYRQSLTIPMAKQCSASTTFFVINDISELEIVFTLLIKAVFWTYLIGVFGLFLIMMNRLNFKKYHLFTYLCLTEIIPFLVLTKWVLEFIQ